jgi:hypothetical protein
VVHCLCDFLSSWHRAFAIQNLLDIFNEHVKLVSRCKSVKPRYIATDFSYALIYACVKSFNGMNLQLYLTQCYEIVSRRCSISQIRHLAFIVRSRAHVSKSVYDPLRRTRANKQQRIAIMYWFVVLQRCADLHSATETYKSLKIALTDQM